MMMKIARVLTNAGLALLLIAPGVALHAQYGPPPGPPPPGYGQGGPGPWDAPPPELNEVQQRGFHDGLIGAQKDYQNHRPPNVENRDEFRHPNVPPPLRHDYRIGFRRGYAAGVRHMMHGGSY
jgi:hypothetical protein